MPDIDRESVILMSKLAIYDSELGVKDRKKLIYFRHDYIYRQNMWMRFFVICGCLVLFGIDLLRKFLSEGIDLISFDYRSEGIKLLVFMVIVLAAYSFAGTIKYTLEYEQASARNEAYLRLLAKLERHRAEGTAERGSIKPAKVKEKRPLAIPGRDETLRMPAVSKRPPENDSLVYNKTDE